MYYLYWKEISASVKRCNIFYASPYKCDSECQLFIPLRTSKYEKVLRFNVTLLLIHTAFMYVGLLRAIRTETVDMKILSVAITALYTTVAYISSIYTDKDSVHGIVALLNGFVKFERNLDANSAGG
jgi:hypothetical protein